MVKGPLILLSGPSGSGKSTVMSRLLHNPELPLRLAVSATTRPPRPNEREGQHYYFWDRPRFERERDADAFLEWAEVYGNYYGTLRREVGPHRDKGVGVILEIDVQGAAAVRLACPDNVSIFLRAPSLDHYEERLRDRGTETEETIRRRVTAARRELDHADRYDFNVINDDVEATVALIQEIIRHSFEET